MVAFVGGRWWSSWLGTRVRVRVGFGLICVVLGVWAVLVWVGFFLT